MATIFNIPTTIYLISEPVQYKGCSWDPKVLKNPPTNISPSKMTPSFTSSSSSIITTSSSLNNNNIPSTTSSTVTSRSSVQEFLNQVKGTLSDSSNSLFPDLPDPDPPQQQLVLVEEEPLSVTLAEIQSIPAVKGIKSSIFSEKIKKPEAAEIQKSLKK